MIEGGWVVLPLGWALICLAIARLTGWSRLSHAYRLTGKFNGRIWWFRSAGFRWSAGYSGSLNLGASPDGLYLAVFPLFRIGHPPLFVPWQDVSRAEGRRFGIRFTRLRFSQAPSIPCTIRGSLGDQIASEIGQVWQLLPNIPS